MQNVSPPNPDDKPSHKQRPAHTPIRIGPKCDCFPWGEEYDTPTEDLILHTLSDQAGSLQTFASGIHHIQAADLACIEAAGQTNLSPEIIETAMNMLQQRMRVAKVVMDRITTADPSEPEPPCEAAPVGFLQSTHDMLRQAGDEMDRLLHHLDGIDDKAARKLAVNVTTIIGSLLVQVEDGIRKAKGGAQ